MPRLRLAGPFPCRRQSTAGFLPSWPRGCHVVRTGRSGSASHLVCLASPVVPGPCTRTRCPGNWWTQARPAPPATSRSREPGLGGWRARGASNPSGRSRSLIPMVLALWPVRPTPNRQVWQRHRHLRSADRAVQGSTGSWRPVALSPWPAGGPWPPRWWPSRVLRERPPL